MSSRLPRQTPPSKFWTEQEPPALHVDQDHLQDFHVGVSPSQEPRIAEVFRVKLDLDEREAAPLLKHCTSLGVKKEGDLKEVEDEEDVQELVNLAPTRIAKKRLQALLEEIRGPPGADVIGDDASANSTPQTPTQQLALAKQRRDYPLCAKLQRFADAYEAAEAKLGAAESEKNWKLCEKLNAELQAFPKTLEEFEAMKEALRNSPQGMKLGQELVTAARSDDLGKVKELVDKDTSVQEKDGNGWTALHWAALNGHAEALTVLLDAGADKEAKNNYGQTALHFAVKKGQAKALTVLLDAGADKEAKTNVGFTALHFATGGGRAEALTMLLDAGADKEAKDKNGLTALLRAAVNGHAEALTVLLDTGADKEAKSNNGRTARDLAIISNKAEVVKLLDYHSGGRAPGKLEF